MKYTVDLTQVNLSDIKIVGGKNASTGEMLQNLITEGIRVPTGFATTADAYLYFISQNNLDDKIKRLIQQSNLRNLSTLKKISHRIRQMILKKSFDSEFEKEVNASLKKYANKTFAVRSSATVEDLAEASFAGQQETFLNVKKENILKAIKQVYASLFTARAIDYRDKHGLTNTDFAISVGIQPMVRSDLSASGVMFTIDTESGFDKVILINAAYGLGEAIVQGKVNPDEFFIYKPALEKQKFSILQRKLGNKAIKMIYDNKNKLNTTIKAIATPIKDQQRFSISDKDIETLASYALIIEKHYGKSMDIEWAKDGKDGKLYILQARPETVKSRRKPNIMTQFKLLKKGKIITQGLSVGQGIGSGNARLILNPREITKVKKGDVLVTDMTDPDWEPIMQKASAIVTNRGGRTCHAAIIARELGIPAVVGSGNATKVIKSGEEITVSCAEGEKGYVYQSKLPFKIEEISVKHLPKLPLHLCLNVGNPEKVFYTQFLPNDGVGLCRLEFIISSIGIHPNAVLNIKKLPVTLQRHIKQLTSCYGTPVKFYVEKLCEGIAKIAAAFYPKQVIFRFSDFKSNEYANLLGGSFFEVKEENPMLGFRGAARYRDDRFRQCFKLECEAFKRVREQMGFDNAQLMIPFVRTIEELQEVIRLMELYGLQRGANSLKIFMMCEIPSNVILAKEFLKFVDGFSIGSNDLTQLVLGLDRDSPIVASLFDERNQAVKSFLHDVISECNRQNKYIGICGQAPSDYPDFAVWLLEEGIQSISLNADTIIDTWQLLASHKRLHRKK